MSLAGDTTGCLTAHMSSWGADQFHQCTDMRSYPGGATLMRFVSPVGVASHEADPVPVLDNCDGVSGKQCAAPFGPSRPVQDGRTVEVTADSCQREPLDFVIKQVDPRGLTLDPVLVGSRDEHAGVESISEVDVGAVEVWVGHADHVAAAQLGDPVSRSVVEYRDPVSEHVAVWRAHEQCPLANPECRFDVDADQVGFSSPGSVE